MPGLPVSSSVWAWIARYCALFPASRLRERRASKSAWSAGVHVVLRYQSSRPIGPSQAASAAEQTAPESRLLAADDRASPRRDGPRRGARGLAARQHLIGMV